MNADQSTHAWRGEFAPASAIAIVLGLGQLLAAQSTGTFLDRETHGDLRVVSYNIFNDSIFPDTDAARAAKFSRVMRALNPDIVNLQEIYNHATGDVVSLMNDILPLDGGATWFAQLAPDNAIVSRFPLSLGRTNTDPASPRKIAIALVDLPDSQFGSDFYLMNNHFRCCGAANGPENAERQRQADALVSWMRDARTPGGLVSLSPQTPMAVIGDLNMVGSLNPLNTLTSGNIADNTGYGPDSPPDWDGTALVDLHPLHNVAGRDDYTFNPGGSRQRLDFVLFTDSVASVAKKFVLNTVTMSPQELTATGLQTYDISMDNSVSAYDHLPIVVDFHVPPATMAGDFNSDELITSLDYDVWRTRFGSTHAAADGNHDGMVDTADYLIWRKALTTSASAAVSAAASPEPGSLLVAITLGSALSITRIRRFWSLPQE